MTLTKGDRERLRLWLEMEILAGQLLRGAKVFSIGDEVEWTSQSAGYKTTKRGVVVQIVPAGLRPDSEAFPSLHRRAGLQRDHDSYVVRVRGRGPYWPRVSLLEPVA